MSVIKSAEPWDPPPPELFEAIDRFADEATRAGVLVQQGGLLPSSTGAEVRIAGGKLSVTDGPFTELKEVIGGFAVFEVASKQEAVEWSRRFMELHRQHWPSFEGACEVRQMMDIPGS